MVVLYGGGGGGGAGYPCIVLVSEVLPLLVGGGVGGRNIHVLY